MRGFGKRHNCAFRLRVRAPLLVWYRNFRVVLSKARHAVVQLVETLRYRLMVVGSIPDGVIGMTAAMGPTQPLTEMSAKNTSWGKGCRCLGLTTESLLCSSYLEIREPQRPGTIRACPRIVIFFCLFTRQDTLLLVISGCMQPEITNPPQPEA
jgi:hypothetical protein